MVENFTNFNKFLDNNQPVFYHFLDGLINPDKGYSISATHRFIDNNLTLDSNINLMYINYPEMSQDMCKYKIEYKSNSRIKILLENTQYLRSEMNNELFNIEYSRIKEILNIFKYCIIHNDSDSHATSIVIFRIENKL